MHIAQEVTRREEAVINLQLIKVLLLNKYKRYILCTRKAPPAYLIYYNAYGKPRLCINIITLHCT